MKNVIGGYMAKVMVADDDQRILDATRLLLEYEGHSVITAGDGETVGKVEKEQPDVVLLDIWLSGASGAEIAKQLKASEKTSHIPVIMFSANRDIERIAEESGADDYLVKPFDLKTLLEKISAHTK